MAALTFKVSDTVSEKANQLYEQVKAENPTLTKAEFFGMMTSAFGETQNQGAASSATESAHIRVLENIKAALQLPEDAGEDQMLEEIRATQQRAMAVPDKIIEQVPEVLGENEIRFPIPEPHLSLLRETANRLSEKFGQQITIRDILLDMFARYTIEQFNQWFYPFVINGDDFKKITGHTQKELKAWLNKVDQEG